MFLHPLSCRIVSQIPIDQIVAQVVTVSQVHATRLVQQQVLVGQRSEIHGDHENRYTWFDCNGGEEPFDIHFVADSRDEALSPFAMFTGSVYLSWQRRLTDNSPPNSVAPTEIQLGLQYNLRELPRLFAERLWGPLFRQYCVNKCLIVTF